MFVALLAIALWAFAGARHTLGHQLDQSLASTAQLELRALDAGIELPREPAPRSTADFIDRVNRFVVLRASDGRVLAANVPFAAALPSDGSAVRRALAGEPTWVTVRQTDPGLRALFTRALDSTQVLEVAASLGPLAAADRQVLFLLLGTVLLGTVATLFGAGWLARSAVTPVSEIAAQASGLRPGVVGQRITAHAEISEFNGLIRVLNDMLERLDRALVTERRMIADIAHDLRTPITAMRGEIEIGLRGERGADQYRAILQSTLDEVDRLASINETMLTLARVEAGELTPRSFPTDVTELAADVVGRAQRRIEAHRLRYTSSADGNPMVLDGKLVALALDQLVDNAIRHTPDGTSILVSVERTPGAVTFAVEDDGPGIPVEAVGHLFERFYRGDTARGRGAGAGLGLTLVAAIAQVHGGSATAERASMGGLRVAFSLPASPSHTD